MEADGGGMVAIIEGLKDSGIAITVMNNRLPNHQERMRQKPKGPKTANDVSRTKSSVETSTDSINIVNRGAQICDGRYASSYQLAHCSMVPTSPPVTVPEFPPQRAEPCRTQGNFELGGYGNVESYHSPRPVSPITSFRNGSLLSDRGSSVYTCRSTHQDAFAHSLRRYPCQSLDSTLSTEFIQRLITYTQTKHSLKNSHQSKSMRSLLREKSPEVKPTRHTQTNLRSKHETPTKDYNNNNEFRRKKDKCSSKKKNFTSESFKEEKRKTKYDVNILNETYDYLKSNIPRLYPRDYGVKHTDSARNEIHKCYPKCPEIMRRYNKHKQEHHSCTREDLLCPKLYATDKRCCVCKKPVPCDCKPGPSRLVPLNEITKPPVCTDIKVDCPCSKNKDTDKDKKYSTETENKMNESVPVYTNESPETKATINTTTKDLAEDQYDEKLKEEIRKFIYSLPMWYPSDKCEQVKLKEQLADNIFGRLKRVYRKYKYDDVVSNFDNNFPLKTRDISDRTENKDTFVDNLVERLKPEVIDGPPGENDYREDLRAEILDTLKELPIRINGNRKEALNQIADSLVSTMLIPHDTRQTKSRKLSISSMESTLQRKILEWLNDNPELPNALISDTNENRTMIRRLEKLLKKYEQNSLNDEKVQKEMQEEVKNWLENVIENKGRIDSKSKGKVSRRLIQKLICSGALKNSERKLDDTSSDINRSISHWLKNIPELSGSSRNEKKKIIQNLADKLLGLDNDDEIRNEIHDWLSETLDENSEYLNKITIKVLVEELTREIRNLRSVNKNNQQDMPDNNNNKMEYKKYGREPKKKFQQLQINGLSEDEMWEEIDDLVRNDYDEIEADSLHKEQHVEKEITNSTPKWNSRKRWGHNVSDSIQEEISRIIDQEPTQLSKYKKQDLKDKIANVLENNISYLSRLSKAGSKSLPDKKRAASESLASLTMPLKKHLKQYLKHEVSDILKKFHINADNLDEVEESITDTLERQIVNGLVSNKTEEDVYNILQDADIPDDQAVNVTSQLVKKANETFLALRNESVGSTVGGMANEISPATRRSSIVSNGREPANDMSSATRHSSIVTTSRGRAKERSSAGRWTPNMSTSREVAKEISSADETRSSIMKSGRGRANMMSSASRQSEIVSNGRGPADEMFSTTRQSTFKSNGRGPADEMSSATRRSSNVNKGRGLANDTPSAIRRSSILRDARGMANEMSLPTRRDDIHIYESEENSPIVPLTDVQTEAFKEGAEKLILDLIEEVTGEDSESLRHRKQAAIGELLDKIGNITYNPKLLEEDKIEEVIKAMRNISLPPELSQERFASELINRIQSLPENTENKNVIPRKNNEKIIYFRPGAESTKMSIIADNIADSYQNDIIYAHEEKYQDKTYNKPKKKKTADLEDKKIDEISAITLNWMNELPINFDATEDKGFKETMARNLAGDIIDRVKYLQLNPGVKSTDQEELEHLKYQVFRWLNKLVSADSLQPLLPSTEDLMDRIRQVKVLQLVEPSGQRKESKMTQGEIPNYSDALQDEISMWLEEIPTYLFKSSDSSYHQQMIKRLTDVIQRQRDNKNIDLNNEIEKCLNEMVSDKRNINKIAENLKKTLNYKGFTGDLSWLPVQDISQFVEENFEGGLLDWLKDLPLYQQRFPQEKRMQEQLIKKLAKELKMIAENAQSSDNTDEQFTDEIIKYLKQFPMDQEQKYDDQFHRRTAAQLLHYLKGLQMFQDISHRKLNPSGEYFTAVIEDWLTSIPLNPLRSVIEQTLFAAIKEDFITRLKQLHQQYDHSRNNEHMMRTKIKEFLLIIPIEASKKQNQKFLNDKVEELMRNLLGVLREQALEREPKADVPKDHVLSGLKDLSRKRQADADSKPEYKKPADLLYDNIENWCEDLPIYLGNSFADREKVKTIKQNITSKLINKVGEMNMNTEIFNDDILYKDLLQDEIKNIFSAVPTNSELESSLPRLIKKLYEKVKEANDKTRDELTGQIYKQQLKDSISNILPTLPNLSSKEGTSFELLKNSVVDAFINLHYVGKDESLKNKFKERIKDEVSKFCCDFKKHYFNSPIDTAKLNQDLYSALCNVPLPNDETMKSEVGQARIKDTINDWVKDLQMKEQSQVEQLRQRKMVSVLAKRLHDMEKEESFHPDKRNDERKQIEIIKWMKKLPLKPGNDDNIAKMAAKLVTDLKNTEESRRLSGLSMLLETTDSTQKTIHGKNSLFYPQISPSTLSNEDSAHLRRIRERTLAPMPVREPRRICKDVGINPYPEDSSTQTEIRTWPLHGNEILSNDHNLSKASGGVVLNAEKNKASGSGMESENNYEVSPHVIVREYHWDSTEGSKLSNLQLPNTQSFQSQRNSICPDQNQSRNNDQAVTPSSVHKQIVDQRCPSWRSPCSTNQPYIRTCSSIQNVGSCTSQQEIPCASTPICPGLSRERDPFPQPCFNTEPSEVELSKNLKNNARPHINGGRPIEDILSGPRRVKKQRDFDYSVHFPDEDDFWDASRISPFTTDEELESIGRERVKNHETVRCRCRERIYTKCAGRRKLFCPCPNHQMAANEAMKNCSKCSIKNCPYPSFLYFKK